MNKQNLFFKKILAFFKLLKIDRVLSLSEQIHFINRLSFLLKSGLPIIQSLELIARQTKNKKIAGFYQGVVSEVSGGRMLSQSLNRFFDDFALSLIDSGERSGFLSANLHYLSQQLKRKKEMVKKMQQALIYPAFVAFATLGITVFLILYIFPKIMPVIRSLNIELPFTTKTVIILSSFFTKFWIPVLAITVLSVLSFVVVLKNVRRFKFFIHRFILRSPFFGKVYQDFLLTNFCRNLSLLLQGGLSIDIALDVLRQSTGNLFLRSNVLEIYDFILQGGRFSDSLLSNPKMFPEVLSQMVAVGEETGSLPAVFENLAEFYETEFSEKIRNISQMVEPVLLMVAGLIVGFVAISIIAPVYEITQSLQKR